MFGLWDSPLTPRSLATSLRLSGPQWDTDGRTIGWVESRSDRAVLVVEPDGGATRDLTPGGLSVRAMVGYGGGDFTLAHGAAYFVGQADQRVYRQRVRMEAGWSPFPSDGLPRPITPAFGAAASPTVSPDGQWVAFVHSYEDVDAIAIVDAGGNSWPVRIAMGRDFYMQPSWHPASNRLAWVEWGHPRMPWDGTALAVADLAFENSHPVVTNVTTVAGGSDTAIYQPVFSPDGRSLYYISDETGFGHLYRRDLATGAVVQLTSGEAEYGEPAWNQGMRRFGITASGRIVAIRSDRGFHRLVSIAPDGREEDLSALHAGYTQLSQPSCSPVADAVALVASSGRQPERIVVIDFEAAASADAPAPRVVRRSDSELVPPWALSAPEAVTWTSFDGEAAHGLYYPPAGEQFHAEGAPPLIVLAHGGPTSQVTAGWAAPAQFFATRGFAVLQVNYRGSTGYGRDYMLKLRESWGTYDVQDCRTGAEVMADRGLADRSRLVIMGGSAGGYTVLQSLVDLPGFYRAAICLFGISNQFALAMDTHKFEARYTDSLLGPLPEAAARYRDRSPLFHAERIVDPIAVFQGDIDRVVPRNQSDAIVASLRARGVPHEYQVYEGEGHGWRKSETIEHYYAACERFLRQYVVFS